MLMKLYLVEYKSYALPDTSWSLEGLRRSALTGLLSIRDYTLYLFITVTEDIVS